MINLYFKYKLNRKINLMVGRIKVKMAGRRGHRRLNMTWKRQMEEHINQIGLKSEDAIDRVK